ncbi:hypothetical protein FHS18_002373 [Paenibacillus phyllosphaerae]|uniref:Protein-glutamine gamma-glutamyltransferase-like C-terminal domain-containing protein n=1 Tax=Paenibacillus phyllosphaerae TaxID=274593 RepID=A0A7W5FMI6_9BACL|nr:DUF4129 domain-containing protein [Paenibacillus phyllosphaerae]MBB3110306.1 hypothetical protein [Paenibacillus phyllosphaerae]
MTRIRETLLVWLRGLVEAIMYLPLLLVFDGYMPDHASIWSGLVGLLLGYPIGYWLNRLAGYRHPFPILIGAIVIGCFYGVILGGVSLPGVFASTAMACGIYRGARMVGSFWQERFTIGHFGGGLLLYFIYSAILLRLDRFTEHRTLFIVCGLAALVLMLAYTNKRIVEGESNQRGGTAQVERAVRMLNSGLVGIVIAVAIFLVFTKQLQLWFSSAWDRVADWIVALLTREPEEAAPLDEPAAPEPQQPMLPEAAEQDPSPWLDWVMYGLVAVVGLFVLWLLLRRAKHLPGWIRKIASEFRKLFRRQRATTAQGYVDEVVAIDRPNRWRQWLKRNLSKEPRAQWSDLTDNREKLRYLYRYWLALLVKDGQPFEPSNTPLEIGRQAVDQQRVPTASITGIADLYSATKYGDKEVGPDRLEQLAQQLQVKRK